MSAAFGIYQSLDVLTMLGFVILIGTVVNNPILIVERALQLVRGEADDGRTGGQRALPRLGRRALGRQLVSTLVTLVLVPLLLGICFRLFPIRPAAVERP